MHKLAKKLIAPASWWTLRRAYIAVFMVGFAWSAVPAAATGGASLLDLYTGQTLTADLNYQGAEPLSAEPVVYGPEQPPTIKQILLEVCQASGYDEDCAQTLLGMAWKESRFYGLAIGDNGRAHGYFQIHYRLHKITLECTRDLKCSAEWTLNYLERNGYPEHPVYATQCHNGCNAGNGYAASAIRAGKRLWAEDKDIFIAVK
ncbi:MAG: hypothetical protein WCT10_01675 [Patescibacteria group bacterium]|jgi:hypothetical protein